MSWAVDHVEDVLRTNTALTKRQREELKEALNKTKAKGLTRIPLCDNTDDAGRCLGHAKMETQTT